MADPELMEPPATMREPPEDPEWLFAYGSLLWRPGFDVPESRVATLRGYARRFYQRSTDHRGTEEYPGRVVTLLPEPATHTVGLALRLPAERHELLRELDVREKNGYTRRVLLVHPAQGPALWALVYVADPGNEEYAGPEPEEALAERIARARGPSGPNREYLLRLAQALEALGVRDEHVRSLAARVRGPAG